MKKKRKTKTAGRAKSAGRAKTKRARVASPKAAPTRARALGFAAAPADEPAWDREVDDNDVPGLNRPATNGFERHQALDHATGNLWANEDISLVQRVESGGRFLWVMWRRSTLPPA